MTTEADVEDQSIGRGVPTTEPLRASWLVGRREIVELLAAWAVAVLLGVGFGKLVLRHDEDNAITRLDDRVERWFVDRRTPTWDSLSWVGSMLADTLVKIVVTVVVVLVMLRVWRRWLEPSLVALSLVLEAAAFIAITEIVARPRPDVPKLESSPVDSSFPSGHTAAAAAYGAVAVVFLWRQRQAVAGVLFAVVTAIVIAVAVSRMYRGMHHLSDVVAGAVLGVASVIAVDVILRRAVQRRRTTASIAP